ncbi:MAG: hypothetical protein KDC80_15510 [Saprospiraceae bacterium]|nr:hypothetical protein [Saprospiraceae bacterium]
MQENTTYKIKFPSAVRRLRLQWEKGDWKVIKETVIPRMTLPRSARLPQKNVSGFWYELIDKNGNLIYRCCRPNPFEASHEFFESDGSMTRKEKKVESFVLDILVPDQKSMAKLDFYSEIDENSERKRTSRKIYSLDIKSGNPKK